MTDIKDNILKAIEAGKVSMRPRWHFVLQAALLLIGTVLAVLALVYLVSFIFYISGQRHGLGELLSSLPWLLLLLAAVFIVILEILVRKYSFAYRKPMLYTVFLILALVIVSGFLIARTSFHRNLFDRAHRGELPFGGPFYRHYEPRPFGHDDFHERNFPW